jgi:hypothetical protein
MLQDETSDCHNATNDKHGKPIELGNEAQITSCEGAPPGPLIRQLVRLLVGRPCELRMSTTKGFRQSEVGLDLEDMHSTAH